MSDIEQLGQPIKEPGERTALDLGQILGVSPSDLDNLRRDLEVIRAAECAAWDATRHTRVGSFTMSLI